jgi:spore coat protein H
MKSMLVIPFILLSILADAFTPFANPPEDTRFPEIKIYLSKNQYSNLQTNNSDKLVFTNLLMMINRDTASVKEVHVRGNNSLKFKRKSLSVELEKTITIHTGQKKTHLKKFNLLNLSMDKHLWHNRWSDLNMETIGLFPLYNSYCTVWINDQPQGIFLLVEKPQQVKAKLKSPYMLRRGPNHTISDEYFEDEEKESAKKYRKQFYSMYSDISTLSDDNLAKQLSQRINLDNYFQFLAFNYLVMNGDYADEVFFYIEPKNQWFEVIPWDYDDILRPVPHEGRTLRNKEFSDKKLFSLEESLDRAIAGNVPLYHRYEQSLKNLLLTLDSTALTETAHQVIRELEQISADQAIADATLFLDLSPFHIVQAKEDILLSIDLILKRRKWILEELK